MSWREVYEMAARAGDQTAIRELDGPPFPPELHYVWSDFLRLSKRRPKTMNGPDYIPYESIEAFKTAADLDVVPEAVEIIERLDDVYMECAYASHDLTPKTKGGS